ncbi:MAG: HpcH/HpaI aldolase family protein [Hyphomicrobiales bacterium]
MSDFWQRLKGPAPLVGYWFVSPTMAAVERVARLGYDFLGFDGQHGLVDYRDMVEFLIAKDAGAGGNQVGGVVRVRANDPSEIGRALDAGAEALMVPMINTADEAAAAVAAMRYPPYGVRSFGPMRSGLRVGPAPSVSNEKVSFLAFIETADGLANVEAIAKVDGVDALYIGPSDLAIALGADGPTDTSVQRELEQAIERIRSAAHDAGIPAGIHVRAGNEAAMEIRSGFAFVSISCDLVHLEASAREHLAEARSQRP